LPTTDASSKPAQPFGHLLVGRILIARGIAKPDQVSACLQQQHAETRINGARRVLGEIVVERGYARHEQIVEALSYQSQQFATLMVGPYRLMAKLGEGGTSVVYRAQAADGARGGARAPEVAIKLLPQQHPGDVAALARFQREVQAGLTLDHPHIVRTLDFGTTRDTNYIVTELMAGGSLAARIEQYGPLNEATALTLLDELLAALGYAWSKGLVHRDIKPSNILFDARGVPKLADLGLASLTREIEVGGERVVGTPHYIAPEQALASPDCDIRADLYSLGATLFYALSGGPPFPETTMVEAINQHLNAAPPAIDHINPAVGPVLAALVR
jgi:serine/threonine protein kinase